MGVGKGNRRAPELLRQEFLQVEDRIDCPAIGFYTIAEPLLQSMEVRIGSRGIEVDVADIGQPHDRLHRRCPVVGILGSHRA